MRPGRTRRAVTRGVRSERLERGHTGGEGLGSAEPSGEDVGAEPERAGLERILLQPEKIAEASVLLVLNPVRDAKAAACKVC